MSNNIYITIMALKQSLVNVLSNKRIRVIVGKTPIRVYYSDVCTTFAGSSVCDCSFFDSVGWTN